MFKPVFSSVLLVLVNKLTITDVSVVAATLTITPIKNFQILSPIFIHHLNLVSLAEIDDHNLQILSSQYFGKDYYVFIRGHH